MSLNISIEKQAVKVIKIQGEIGIFTGTYQ